MNSDKPAPAASLRWIAVATFALFTALNYLDRQTLSALAPEVKAEFRLSNEDYGWLQSAFYLVYAIASPFAGLFIDRAGLNAGALLSISAWSLAAMATGWATDFTTLALCRMALGVAEAGGIPAFGKAGVLYLQPKERALGTGLNSLGVSLGSLSAPLIAGFFAVRYGWRAAFFICGAISLLWLPIWLAVRRRTPPPDPTSHSAAPAQTPGEMLRDSRLWILVLANILVMSTYQLWTIWTTLFLVQRYQLPAPDANRLYAWIPPIFAAVGGLFGGWLALRWMNAGASWAAARSRVILYGALISLLTVAVPLMPTPALATAMVSLSFLCANAVSANVYALPQDIFGPRRTAFAVSAITSGYGLMLTLYLPFLGRIIDRYGFFPVCALNAALPLAGWLLLHRTALRPERVR